MSKQWRGNTAAYSSGSTAWCSSAGGEEQLATLAGKQEGKAVERQRGLGTGLGHWTGGEAWIGTNAAGAAGLCGGGLLLCGAAVRRHIACRAQGGLGGGGVGQGAADQGCRCGALAAGRQDVGRGGGGGQAGRHILGIGRQGGSRCCRPLALSPGANEGGGAGGRCLCPEGIKGSQLGQCSVDMHSRDAAAGIVVQRRCVAGLRTGRGRAG